jgi:hypothetical protein
MMRWRPVFVVAAISVGATSAIAIVSAAMGWTVHSPAFVAGTCRDVGAGTWPSRRTSHG